MLGKIFVEATRTKQYSPLAMIAKIWLFCYDMAWYDHFLYFVHVEPGIVRTLYLSFEQ